MCVSLGVVKLKSGKMSSRKGTVIMFNKLRELLAKRVYADFLEKHTLPDAKEKWSPDEIARAQHLASLATIKYGMLKQDAATVPSLSLSLSLSQSPTITTNRTCSFARAVLVCSSYPMHGLCVSRGARVRARVCVDG
jgi:arginyl-tRNA synthetase